MKSKYHFVYYVSIDKDASYARELGEVYFSEKIDEWLEKGWGL